MERPWLHGLLGSPESIVPSIVPLTLFGDATSRVAGSNRRR
jgi:hypothetical protein